MSRPPKQPELLNETQLTAYRHLFLQVTDKVCPEVFRQLRRTIGKARDDIHDLCENDPGWHAGDEPWAPRDTIESITLPCVRKWAVQFHVADTWIEGEAREFARKWIMHPELLTSPLLPLAVLTIPSLDRCEEFVLTVPIPFELRFERPYYQWERLHSFLKRQVEQLLEDRLTLFHERGLSLGALSASQIPGDLETKMAVTALYTFRHLSLQYIATTHHAADRTTLHRWIHETTKLLDLKTLVRRRATTDSSPASSAAAPKNVAKKERQT